MTAPNEDTVAAFRALRNGCILSVPFWVVAVAVTVWVVAS